MNNINITVTLPDSFNLLPEPDLLVDMVADQTSADTQQTGEITFYKPLTYGRTQFRAHDVNGNVLGLGTTGGEALQDMAATLGDTLKDQDTPEGVDWYVLRFEQEQDQDTGEWLDLDDDGELVAESPDDAAL